ncbi:unnamed protein product [Polarella glacialis]|uniref:Uncharacterized protein n=1 Tax=Polarella glacialis TaxID=89957 RepID=A0A813G472_POLGL|nr:unnamed protein product [Polarella glacialis]
MWRARGPASACRALLPRAKGLQRSPSLGVGEQLRRAVSVGEARAREAASIKSGAERGASTVATTTIDSVFSVFFGGCLAAWYFGIFDTTKLRSKGDRLAAWLRSRDISVVVFELDRVMCTGKPRSAEGLPQHELEDYLSCVSQEFLEAAAGLHSRGFLLAAIAEAPGAPAEPEEPPARFSWFWGARRHPLAPQELRISGTELARRVISSRCPTALTSFKAIMGSNDSLSAPLAGAALKSPKAPLRGSESGGGSSDQRIRQIAAFYNVNVKKVVLFTASEENVRDGDSWIGVLIPDPKVLASIECPSHEYTSYSLKLRTWGRAVSYMSKTALHVQTGPDLAECRLRPASAALGGRIFVCGGEARDWELRSRRTGVDREAKRSRFLSSGSESRSLRVGSLSSVRNKKLSAAQLQGAGTWSQFLGDDARIPKLCFLEPLNLMSSAIRAEGEKPAQCLNLRPRLSVHRFGAAAAVVAGRLYVGGGFETSSARGILRPSKKVECYDPDELDATWKDPASYHSSDSFACLSWTSHLGEVLSQEWCNHLSSLARTIPVISEAAADHTRPKLRSNSTCPYGRRLPGDVTLPHDASFIEWLAVIWSLLPYVIVVAVIIEFLLVRGTRQLSIIVFTGLVTCVNELVIKQLVVQPRPGALGVWHGDAWAGAMRDEHGRAVGVSNLFSNVVGQAPRKSGLCSASQVLIGSLLGGVYAILWFNLVRWLSIRYRSQLGNSSCWGLITHNYSPVAFRIEAEKAGYEAVRLEAIRIVDAPLEELRSGSEAEDTE